MAGVKANEPVEIMEARAAQLAHHEQVVERYARRMKPMEAYGQEARYVPPADEDVKTWEGIVQYCGVMYRQLWHMERLGMLRAGKGPFYCPVHEAKPEKGWKALGCIECAWGTLDDPGPSLIDCLRLARDLCRPFACSHCDGRQFRRGDAYLGHFGAAA